MGLLLNILSLYFRGNKWRSIFSTKTLNTNKECTSSRSSSKPQTHSSWMSNAHNAIPSIQSSQTPKRSAYAPTANISWPSQEVERLSSLSELPGEERETDHPEKSLDEWIRTQKLACFS